MGRVSAALLAFAASLVAEEPDASVAAATYWTGPGGCASRSYASNARPLYGEAEEAWRLELGRIWGTPVYWHGTGFILASPKGHTELIAFDLGSGSVLAREKLAKGHRNGAELQVWDHTAFVETRGGSVHAYRFVGDKFRSPWVFNGRKRRGKWERPVYPVVHDNELYCGVGSELWRLRPGSRAPVWKADLALGSPPLVYGRWLMVRNANRVRVLRRSDGRQVGQRLLNTLSGSASNMTINGRTLCVNGGRLCIPILITKSGVSFGRSTHSTYLVRPTHHRLGLLVASNQPSTEVKEVSAGWWEWRLMVDAKRFYPLANTGEQPDLLRARQTPVVLGDVVYFGTWAADIETSQILWRLDLKDLTHPVVPADRMVLVVSGASTLHAFRGRGRR